MSDVNELGALEVLQKIFSATRWKLAYIRVAEKLIQKAKPVFQKMLCLNIFVAKRIFVKT